jgi:hypothetical protein
MDGRGGYGDGDRDGDFEHNSDWQDNEPPPLAGNVEFRQYA